MTTLGRYWHVVVARKSFIFERSDLDLKIQNGGHYRQLFVKRTLELEHSSNRAGHGGGAGGDSVTK